MQGKFNKIIFMGTPGFAVPSLERLIAKGFNVIAVVTQPDRPKGRGQRVQPSAVKAKAMEQGLSILQPEKIKHPDVQHTLTQLAPELIVVIAYGQILPETILKIPPYGCINVHASLLPKYRGAAPINWAIMNGEKESGVTTMLMEKGMDAGPILLQERVPIESEDTAGSLHDKLAQCGANLLLQTLEQLEKGSLCLQPQDATQATYAPLLKKTDELIRWTDSAGRIHNKVRGLSPWPGAYTFFKEKTLKIQKTRLLQDHSDKTTSLPGTILEIRRGEGPLIKTGEGGIILLELQPENRRSMTGEEFCRGYRVIPGDLLGGIHE
jgi:methionyl-tRNA formyltransferase